MEKSSKIQKEHFFFTPDEHITSIALILESNQFEALIQMEVEED